MGTICGKGCGHITRVDDVDRCPECNSSRVQEDWSRGEIFCPECGLVIMEKVIDRRLEWGSNETDRNGKGTKTGPSTSLMLHDKGLSTEMSWKDVDAVSRNLSSAGRSHLHRIRRWQKRLRAINSVERNLLNAFIILERVCSNLRLPSDVRQEACVIYRKVVSLGLVRGRAIEGMVSASIYAATRVVGIPRSLDEVANVSGRERKELGRDYKIISKWLKMSLPPTDPRKFVSRFCSELELDMQIERKAIEILNVVEHDPVSGGSKVAGKDPTGVAAAAIYLASIICRKKATQLKLSKTAGITEVTLRNRFKELVAIPGCLPGDDFPAAGRPPYGRIHAATFDSYIRKTTLRSAEEKWEAQAATAHT